jgi:hypothetical protein
MQSTSDNQEDAENENQRMRTAESEVLAVNVLTSMNVQKRRSLDNAAPVLVVASAEDNKVENTLRIQVRSLT